MAPTEMIQDGIPISRQLAAELSKLSSQAEDSSLLQSAQAPTIDDVGLLDSKLKEVQLRVLAEKPKDRVVVTHELYVCRNLQNLVS